MVPCILSKQVRRSLREDFGWHRGRRPNLPDNKVSSNVLQAVLVPPCVRLIMDMGRGLEKTSRPQSERAQLKTHHGWDPRGLWQLEFLARAQSNRQRFGLDAE